MHTNMEDTQMHKNIHKLDSNIFLLLQIFLVQLSRPHTLNYRGLRTQQQTNQGIHALSYRSLPLHPTQKDIQLQTQNYFSHQVLIQLITLDLLIHPLYSIFYYNTMVHKP